MSLALIAAIAENNCIGKNNQLPWHIPEDLKHFKDVTADTVVLMGRKTWESIPEKFRPLPKRINIVISRQPNLPLPPGVEVYQSIDAALGAHANDTVVVIGGAEIYKQTIDRADTLYITHIQQTVDGDAFFPTIDPGLWKETEREKHDGFDFVTYKKR